MALTAAFDEIYKRHAPKLPVEYLRALAQRETSSSPRYLSKKKTYAGIFSAGVGSVTDYNKRTGADVTHRELVGNVELATKVLANYYDMTQRVFDRQFAAAPALGVNLSPPQWKNPVYVRLVTMAWNSGIGATFGAMQILTSWEEKKSPRDLTGVELPKVTKKKDWPIPKLPFGLTNPRRTITQEGLFHVARQVGWSNILNFSRAKEKWQASVANLYFEQLRGDVKPTGRPGKLTPGEPVTTPLAERKGAGTGLGLLILAWLLFGRE